MLQDLMQGHERSKFVLITDSIKSPGRILLLNWIHSLALRCDKVVVVCFERPPSYFKNWLTADLHHRTVFLACQQVENYEDELEAVQNLLRSGESSYAILVDSLSLPLALSSTSSVCCWLHKLMTNPVVSQVVTVLHKDVHDMHTCDLLRHHAVSVVDMIAQADEAEGCHIQHLRPTGKIMKSSQTFKIDEHFCVKDIRPMDDKIAMSKDEHQNVMNDDPASQLTFNLTLTDSEKEARSQLVLPYLQTGSGETKASQGGRILYQPDEADDLDEEDPDDDLNI